MSRYVGLAERDESVVVGTVAGLPKTSPHLEHWPTCRQTSPGHLQAANYGHY